jgi:hypothetical protein
VKFRKYFFTFKMVCFPVCSQIGTTSNSKQVGAAKYSKSVNGWVTLLTMGMRAERSFSSLGKAARKFQAAFNLSFI